MKSQGERTGERRGEGRRGEGDEEGVAIISVSFSVFHVVKGVTIECSQLLSEEQREKPSEEGTLGRLRHKSCAPRNVQMECMDY